MESALIVSYSDKGLDVIVNLLRSISCKKISTAKTCGEARRLSTENSFDLYIINSPVYTESGELLAKELVTRGTSQVIMIVKNDVYDAMSRQVENAGIITISKPLNKMTLWTTLKLVLATHSRLLLMQHQNLKLSNKIDDIKLVDRAKCILISHLNMSESEAHKFIEKKAMDKRVSRKEIAKNILKTYEM